MDTLLSLTLEMCESVIIQSDNKRYITASQYNTHVRHTEAGDVTLQRD